MAFEIYKKGQGKYTRMGTAIGTGLLLVLGCYSLFVALEGVGRESISVNTQSWIRSGVPAVIFVVLGWLIFKAVNTPRFADFLIATEGEMKKVSWSSRKEIITSTKVVIVTVIVMAIILGLVDIGFTWVFVKIGVLRQI